MYIVSQPSPSQTTGRRYFNSLLLGLADDEGLALAGPDGEVGKDLLGAELDGDDVGRLVGNFLLQFLAYLLALRQRLGYGHVTYQVVKDTLVELPLSRAALPQLVVAVVEALPVLAELSQAVGVDILDTIVSSLVTVLIEMLIWRCREAMPVAHALPPNANSWCIANVHTLGAAGNAAALLHAVKLAAAGVLGLALHVVVVVFAASCADEERCRQERGRAGTDLLDRRDVIG